MSKLPQKALEWDLFYMYVCPLGQIPTDPSAPTDPSTPWYATVPVAVPWKHQECTSVLINISAILFARPHLQITYFTTSTLNQRN